MRKPLDLRPSSAHRWLRCPGSVRLSEGIPDESSDAAAEGTFAHGVAARCLDSGGSPETGYTDGRFTVTNEMAAAIQLYLDAVRLTMLLEGSDSLCSCTFAIEERVDVCDDLAGTPDAVVDTDTALHVFDFKYGSGVFVPAERNVQELTYAVGWLNELLGLRGWPSDGRVVVLHIVQPRYHGPAPKWRAWSLPERALWEWYRDELKPGIARCKADKPELAAGDWCRWCPAKAVCPKLRETAVESAKHVFGASPTEPPSLEALSSAEIAKCLDLFPLVEQWISAVRKHAYREADRGRPVPGYKLVQKTGNRVWTNDEQADAALREAGVDPTVVKRSLCSPAEAERRLVDAGLFQRKGARVAVDKLAHKPVTGTVLVPESHPSPEYRPGDVFLDQ
jgi:hypothetical protein